MNSELRKCIIAGNWKMNKTPVEAGVLAAEITDAVGEETDITVIVCPPFIALERVANVLEHSNIELGAQNMHSESVGAFTGEISAEMLRSFFCDYVIIGHSERRTSFGETDSFINAKVLAALANNLKPIICIGETLAEREQGKTMAVLKGQLDGAVKGVTINKDTSLVIAYEPVWAIGTGRNATPEIAQEAHLALRATLASHFGELPASKIRILYGGSMNIGNASELLDQPDIDGGLIGGASLETKSFIQLVTIAKSKLADN